MVEKVPGVFCKPTGKQVWVAGLIHNPPGMCNGSADIMRYSIYRKFINLMDALYAFFCCYRSCKPGGYAYANYNPRSFRGHCPGYTGYCCKLYFLYILTNF